MTDRELMQQALEAILENRHIPEGSDDDGLSEVITALRERLAQPVQEPVATVTSESGNPNVSMSWWHEPALPVGTKIYTSPQPSKPWVGLTDEEKAELDAEHGDDTLAHLDAIEAKLREKNA